MRAALEGLAEQLAALGTPGEGRPFLLGARDEFRYVAQGALDLFLVETRDGEPAGARLHLFRIGAGQLLPGTVPDGRDGFGWLAVPTPQTRCFALPAERLGRLLADPEHHAQAVRLAEGCVSAAGAFLEDLPPKPDAPLLPGGEVTCAAAPLSVFAPGAGLWARLEAGEAHFLGRGALPIPPGLWLPLPQSGWLALGGGARVAGVDGAALAGEGALWSGLEAFLQLLHGYAVERRQALDGAELERLRRRSEQRAEAMAEALEGLAGLLAGESDMRGPVTGDPLLAACQAIGDRLGLRFRPAPGAAAGSDGEQVLRIAEASGVRCRRVALKGRWWRQDGGPLLAFLAGQRAPVALLPDGRGGYRARRPADATATAVDGNLAAQLDPFAYTFYRALPEGPLTPGGLLRFGLAGRGRELLLVLAVAVLGTLLGMAVPMASGHLFDTVLPAADRSQLAQVVAALLAAALAGALFEATRSYAMLRVESLMNTDLQAAVWDRVLKLPVPFFRDYTAGDLATRIMGVNAIRQALSGAAVAAILSGLFSVLNVFLLLRYSPRLALVAALLVAVSVGFSALIGYLSLRATREEARIAGRVSGLVLQYLNGIAKLRVAGAEARAFGNWSAEFVRQRRFDLRAGRLANASAVFNAAFRVAADAVLFAAIVLLVMAPQQEAQAFSTGSFVAFSAAFGVFLQAALGLVQTALGLLAVVPLYERIEPILRAAPEVDTARPWPGELGGRIEVSRLSFRYSPEGPPVLDDISLQIEPGEFVALVGPSGSGKSTLLRLLLGFEKPHAGAIHYDGHNLADVDVAAVRRQLGVVLQNGRLMSGDLFSNIVGAHALTLEDAWAAARACGLDDDIKAMPMGMQTLVSEGGGTLSGGQRQRVLIARAIVNRPRILYFDEATSALDNRTQAVVSASLERLRATRVVVAHRLSTIENADRILVMEGGRIVQEGRYQDLIRQEGPFADLAKRQVA